MSDLGFREQRWPMVVFREQLGMESETFIYAQAAALRTFAPHFLGIRISGALPMQNDRVEVVAGNGPSGRLRSALFKFACVAPRATRYLRAIAPRLIHAHFGPDGAMIAPFARRLGIPMIATFHGYDATISRKRDSEMSATFRLYRRRTPLLQRYPRLVIAVSDFIKEKLFEQGYDPARVVRHYIGIDLKTFRPDPGVPRERIVLFAARLVEKKGCAHLIDAMRDVTSAAPGVRLVVIGDGPLRASLESRARAAGVEATFLGRQPPSCVRDWMRRATLFAVPSITAASGDAEGFGMVFAEAAAVGTPVVSFASGGLRESVADGVTGLLAPEGDTGALARHLVTLLSEPLLWERMSRAGIERVKRLFDIDQQTAGLEEIYRSALAPGLDLPQGSGNPALRAVALR